MKLTKKIIAIFLSILTLFSICSTSTTVFAAEYTEQKARTEYFDSALSGYLKNIVDTEDAISISEKEQVDEIVEEVNSSVARNASTFSLRATPAQSTETAKEAAEDLDIDHTRLTLELEDGENVAYLFSEPVSFIDDAGNLVYKDTNIRAVTDTTIINRGYSYENGDNDYKAYFSEDSSKGLLLVEKDGEEIRLVPNGTQSVGTVEQIESDMELVDSFEYAGVYGIDTVLRFLPQLNGCKEEIVLSSYQGISDFSFTLYTEEGTIAAINSNGEVEIIDSATKDIITTFVAPFAYDSADGFDETSEHYTDCTYELEMISEGKYILTISVPKEYLESESTVYPVVIDPTTDNISMTYDTSIYSVLKDSPQSSNPTACFGKTGSSQYGKGRAMFKFKIPSDIEDYAKISSAKLWLRETTGRTETMYVRPYVISESWDNSVTWSTKPAYKSTITYPTKSDLVMPRKNINSASTDKDGNPYLYAFDIIYAVKSWTTNHSKNYGLVFIAECEASDGDYLWRAFATKEHTTSSYRPYVVIKYTNDVTPPEITDVEKDPDVTYTNKDVTVTVTASDNVYKEGGISKYSFDNGSSWQTPSAKKYTKEGTYTPKVIAKDLAGNNSDTQSVSKFIIDKTAPKISQVNNPANGVWKNTNVTVKITATDNLSGVASYSFDNGSNWQTSNSKTYSSNGTYTITAKAKDNATNVSSAVSGGTVKIDKSAPSVSTVSGNPTSWTSSDVTLTVTATDTGGSGVAYYSFDNGSTWQTSNAKTFSTNQTVYIKVKDAAGNISAVRQEIISKIDKTAPTASVSSTATSASTKVTVTASDALSGLHSTPYSFDGGSTWQESNTKIVTSTTTLSIKVRDKAGNIKTLSHTPSATLPITITPSITEWTNKNVRLTVTGTGISQYKFDSGSYSTTNYKDYSGNTTASITVKDSNSKTKTVTYKITNIDKTNPVISNVSLSETEWTDKDVSITVTASDALSGLHSTAYSFDGGKTWQASNTLTVSENGTYNVVVRDKATNKTTWSDTIIIDYIDKTDPVVPSVYEQDGTLYISAPSLGETDGSPETLKYQLGDNDEDNYIAVEGNSIELDIVRTYDVPVYAYVEDGAGNKAETTFTLENNLGEYTASYTDIALGEGLFPIEFGRTYTSTNGWFFTFDANVVKIDDNAYVFTNFYGEKQYFIKNGEGKYLSIDDEELTINADSYVLTYGDMTCTFGILDGKIKHITTDYLDTAYTWEDNKLTIDGGATVTFSGGKPTGIEIERENKKKTIEYNWTTEKILETDEAGNPTEKEIIRLTSFKDAAGKVHVYDYLGATELLTTNDTETISYSNGRVKLISQPNGAFVKYTYNDTAASTNTKTPKNIGSVTVSDSKGVTDTIPYSDGVYVSSSLDSYSDKAVYAPGEISAGVTTDAISNIVYVVESEPQSEEQGTDEPSTGDEPESDGENATDNEAEDVINGEENAAEQGEDNNAPSEPELPLYEAINENTYVFYDYDEQNRVATELTVLKSKIADITTATFEDAEKVVKTETVYVYASETDNTITDKYVFTYTDDVKLQTEELYQPINNVLFCVSKFTYDSNENIVLEQYFKQETVNETTVDVEYENCTRVYEGENVQSETYQTLVDGVLTTTKKLSYEYYEGGNIKTETQQTLIDGVLTTTKKLSYEYDIGDQLTSYTVEEYTMGDLRLVSSESYNYNNFGNLEKEIIEEYTYVLNSNTSKYDRVPNTIEKIYAYDIWNQQINITVKKTGEADLTTVITYDELGNTSTVTEDGVAVAYTYSNGNVSTITETKELQQDNGTKVTKTVTSVYGYTDGNLVSRTNTTEVDEVVTETTVASYGYDEYGNLTYHEFNGYAFTYNTLGSILTAKAAVKKDENGEKTNAGIDIVSYTYSPDIKQDVEFSSFGNNQIIDYDYNADGEITAIKLGADADPKYEYKYSSEAQTETEGEDILTANLDGEWVKINDKVSGLFKVIQENKTSVYDSANNFVYSMETSSKDADNADSFDGTVTTIGGNVYTLVTEENEDTFKTNDIVDFSKKYVYNEEESELKRTLTSNVFYTDYGYGDNGVKVLENVFEEDEYGEITEGYIFSYGYENENISSESLTVKSKAEDGSSNENTESVSYEYDDNDQLVKADYGDVLYEYVYDYSDDESIEYECRGNITKKTITDGGVSQTVVYEYDDVWKDKLISYNGQTITYDAVGNPINYMGNALTWTMGRQLASFGSNTYTYNEDGIRTSKTVNGVKTTFLLDGYNVIEQTDGTTTLHFFYDSNGEVIGFRYNENDYFYVKNAMSDIIAITDSNKNVVAEYRYDPWGKVLNEDNLTAIGNLNPFRYRSYYYDSDIKMYYLQSRYYDAEVGRFINCDDVNYIGITESEVSYNPFAYCENNSINNFDPFGESSYINISSSKSKNWEYIISQSISLYEGSKIYKKAYSLVCVRDRYGLIKNVKVPTYMFGNATVYKKTGVLILNYFNLYGVNKDSKYTVTLGCMTVDDWDTFIVGKHRKKLKKIKKTILKELKISSEKFDEAVEVAQDLYEIISSCLEIAGKVPNKIAIDSATYKIIRKIVKYAKKYDDKQDKYIRKIISGKEKKDTVLILLYRRDYVYNSIYYQKGVYWVCETGWHLQNTVRMY